MPNGEISKGLLAGLSKLLGPIAPEPKDEKPVRALIVEKVRRVGERWARTLVSTGFDVEVVSGAGQSIRALADQEFDALLIDLDLNGDRAQADTVLDIWLRENEGPVCVVSNRLMNGVGMNYFQRGVDNVFPKPMQDGAIMGVFIRYLRRIRIGRRVEALRGRVKSLEAYASKLRKYLIMVGLLLIFSLSGADDIIREAIMGSLRSFLTRLL